MFHVTSIYLLHHTGNFISRIYLFYLTFHIKRNRFSSMLSTTFNLIQAKECIRMQNVILKQQVNFKVFFRSKTFAIRIIHTCRYTYIVIKKGDVLDKIVDVKYLLLFAKE